MSRKAVHEWIILLTYLFFLIIITVHSGYLGRKLLFVSRQFLPLVFAGILAFVLNHPYEYVRSFFDKSVKLPEKAARIAGLLTVYVGAIGIVAAVLRFALPHFVSGLQGFIENREGYMQAFESSLLVLLKKAGIEDLNLSPLMEGISGYIGQLDEIMDEIFPKMAGLTTGALRSLATFGITAVLSAYILYDKEKLKCQMKRLYRAYMPKSIYDPVKHLALTAMTVFDRFIAGQGLESLILGSLCFVGMFLLGLEYSGIVSLVVGLTAFIPLLGAYIGGGLGVVLLLFISVKKALTFLIFFVILQQVENNLIYPRVVGKRTGLPGLWVLAAVTIGGGLFGVFGMVLSVPAATFLYVIIQKDVAKREMNTSISKSTGQKDKNKL